VKGCWGVFFVMAGLFVLLIVLLVVGRSPTGIARGRLTAFARRVGVTPGRVEVCYDEDFDLWQGYGLRYPEEWNVYDPAGTQLLLSANIRNGQVTSVWFQSARPVLPYAEATGEKGKRLLAKWWNVAEDNLTLERSDGHSLVVWRVKGHEPCELELRVEGKAVRSTSRSSWPPPSPMLP
jgi:hypothetical protein